MMDEAKKAQMLQIGGAIIILLASLTLVEYLIGAYVSIWWGAAVLFLISLIKASFIVRQYMHIGRLFSGDEEVH